MLCILSENTNPYYNLATEEYLLKQTGEDIFMLWQSTPVVVAGKHQNVYAEINYRFVRSENIQVARRLTGGGAVYHDGGNLNFSFIRNGEPGKLVDFELFIRPVLGFLSSNGITATQGSKNEILVNKLKISGNAEHVYRNRVLHHGTLLFSTDLHMLHESIKPGQGKYTDKAVQSNRSQVINLVDCFYPVIPLEGFRDRLFEFIRHFYSGTVFVPNDHQVSMIMQLANEKYRSWDWIYGWSPDYTFTNNWMSDSRSISINLQTHRGIVTHCELYSDHIAGTMCRLVSNRLRGMPHNESSINYALEKAGFNDVLPAGELEDLMLSFF